MAIMHRLALTRDFLKQASVARVMSVFALTLMMSVPVIPLGRWPVVFSQGSSAVPTSVYQRNWQQAQAVALGQDERPRRFIVSDCLLGPADGLQSDVDSHVLDYGLETLAFLGINTAEVKLFGKLSAEVADRARHLGITRFRRAVAAPYGPGFFAFDTKYFSSASVDAWAAAQARDSLNNSGIDPEDVVLFHLADEPGWYYPEIIAQITADQQALKKFRKYLRSKQLNPQDLGAAAWAEVFPIGQSMAKDLPSRRLFLYTVRFVSESMADGMRQLTLAVKKHFNTSVLTTSNWNNGPNVYYLPSPNAKIYNSPIVNTDTAYGGPLWMDFGRKAATGAMWSQDWVTDRDSSAWALNADMLRSVAQTGGTEFGGYIVGRKLQGPQGARLKAFSLLGRGAKVIEWYVYGPEERFAGNGYSNNPNAYEAIASANRLIAKSEDLLFPGRPLQSKVALLLPDSSRLWDTREPGQPSSLGLNYDSELGGIHAALTHSHYPVDFIDEQSIAMGELRGYQVLYVTAPNMTQASQTALSEWIRNGGVAIFSPGAAAADELNTPTHILDDARGVVSRVLPRSVYNWGTTDYRAVTFSDTPIHGNIQAVPPGSKDTVIRQTEQLKLTTAKAIAKFDDGGTAVASHKNGKGIAISFGYFAGQLYFDSGFRTVKNLPVGWDGTRRLLVTAGPRAAGVVKPVELDQELVEATRLESKEGIVVTLLNWSDTPINQLSVRVPKSKQVERVEMAEAGAVPFEREGNGLRVRVPLKDVDVLKIYLRKNLP